MADKKISALTPNTSPTWSEEFVYAYNNSNGKITLDTMKTFASADSQPTLVSGTNIKTINNQSILWSGNITISWGSEENDYDCVVDVNGTWDYTTISDAITAWKQKLFVKNWTYTMASWTLSTWDFKMIWESEEWVIVNISYATRNGTIFTLTSDTTSATNNFLFKNITFNITYTWEYWYFIMFGWMWQWEWFLKMQNCAINIPECTNWCNFYITSWSYNDTLLEQCLINIYPTTWNFSAIWFTWISRRSVCIDSTIILDASWSIWTSWIVFGWNADWNYINCHFKIGNYHQKSWDIAQMWCGHWIMCNYLTSNYANIRIYWTQESCTFSALWQNANYDTGLNTAVTSKKISIWKPSTSYSVWDYVQSWTSNTLAKCITAHTSWASYDSSKFENVYWDLFIAWYLKYCSVTARWTVVVSWFALYDSTVAQPAIINNISNTQIQFIKQSSSLSNIANLVLLSWRWFNDNQVYTDSTSDIHIYIWWESSTFTWNRIISYSWDIYSWWYGNVITNNIYTYCEDNATPTITQVTSGNSQIANNVIRGVADWN